MSWGFVRGCVVTEFGFSGGERVAGSAERNLAGERKGEGNIRNEAVVRRKYKSIELRDQFVLNVPFLREILQNKCND